MSPKLALLRSNEYARTPWKNGLGWTEQIAIHPPGADLRRGDFAWRVSSARVAQSAPFSVFPEHDRILVILEGEGVRLSHTFVEGEEAEIVDLPELEPYEFPGDVPTRCDLKAGPIQDFSIFLRKGEVSVVADVAEATAEEPFGWEPQGRTCFLFLVSGSISVDGLELGARDALRVDLGDEPSQEPLMVRSKSAGSKFILVQID